MPALAAGIASAISALRLPPLRRDRFPPWPTRSSAPSTAPTSRAPWRSPGRLAPHVGGIKLGLEFFTAQGPRGVEAVAALGLPIFLDLKLHDIPNTVAGAVREVARLGVAMLTLHAAGGRAMLEAAAAAAASSGPRSWASRC